MLGIKLRACTLGLMALLLVGSYAASAAYAEAGPFWHHRALSGSGEGSKIEENAPEEVKGEGGEQKLKGKVLGVAIEIKAASVQVKAFIYNNSQQAQSRLLLTYHTLTVVGMPNCITTVGVQNTVKLYGHQAWKWNGTKTQLEQVKQRAEQHPDWIFLPVELQAGATALPKAVFAKFKFASKNSETEKCSLAGVEPEVTGSATGEIEPSQLETWSPTQTIKTPEGKQKQHFWNGKEAVGVETGLLLGAEPASLVGTTKATNANQENALFEK